MDLRVTLVLTYRLLNKVDIYDIGQHDLYGELKFQKYFQDSPK